MAVLMKEPTIRSPGFDEQQECALGPLDELQRSFEVSRVEVAAAARSPPSRGRF